jgi:3-hydroxybutyrate dehydrogenase
MVQSQSIPPHPNSIAVITSNSQRNIMLKEKEPSLQFTTTEELGTLALFLCSPEGNNVRGVAWNMDGGWAAQ